MGLDGGSIRAQVDLDLQQFDQNRDALRGRIQEIGALLQSIPDARINLDIAAFDRSAQQVQQQAAQVAAHVGEEIQKVPGIPLTIDPQEAAKTFGQTQQVVDQVNQQIDHNVHQLHLPFDQAGLSQDVNQAKAQMDSLNHAIEDIGKATARPHIGLDDLKSGVGEAQSILGNLFTSMQAGAKGKLSLDISGFEQAAGLALGTLSLLTGGFGGLATAATKASQDIGKATVELLTHVKELGEQYEAAFRAISVRTGATGEDLEHFEQNVRNVAASGYASLSTIADVLPILSERTHLSGSALDALTTKVLQFAAVTKQDATTAARELTEVFAAWHVATDHTMDVLLRVTQETQIPMRQLLEEMGRMGPAFQAAGFSMTETAVILGRLSELGPIGSQAMFGIRTELKKLADEGADPRTALLGIMDALGQMQNQAAATDEAMKLFGTRGGPAILELARSGKVTTEALEEMTHKAETAGDTVASAAGRGRSGAVELHASIQALERAFAPLGEAIAKVVNQLERELAVQLKNVAGIITQILAVNNSPEVKALNELVEKSRIAVEGFANPGETEFVKQGGLLGAAGRALKGETAEAAPEHGQGGAESAAAGAHAESVADQDLTETIHGLARSKAELSDRDRELLARIDEVAGGTAKQKTEIQQLDEQIKKAGSNEALLTNLYAQKAAAEAVQKAIGGDLGPALQAYFTAQERGLALADEQAKSAQAGADATAKRAKALVDEAASTEDSARASTLLLQALTLQAQADQQGAAAAEKASEAQKTRTSLVTEARTALATQQVEQGRLNELVSAAKPLLDAEAEVALKAAVAHSDQAAVLDILQQKLGLTNDQINALLPGLTGTNEQAHQAAAGLKALTEPTEALNQRYTALAQAVLPALSKAQADQVTQLIEQKRGLEAATSAYQAAGISTDRLAQVTTESGVAFEHQKTQASDAAKAAAEFGQTIEDKVNKELDQLAHSAFPALTAAQQAHVELLAKSGEHFAAYAEAVALAGGKVQSLTDIESANANQLQNWQNQISAVAKATDANSIAQERLNQAVGSVAKDVDSNTAAWLRNQVAQGNAQAALAQLAGQLGFTDREVQKLTADLEVGGRAAQNAMTQIQTAVQYQQSNFAAGQSTQGSSNQIDTAIQKYQDTIQSAQQDYRTQMATLAEKDREGEVAFNVHITRIAEAQSDAQNKLNATNQSLDARSDAAAAKFGERLADISSKENDALTKISAKQEEAAAKYKLTIGDATDKLGEAVGNAITRAGEAVEKAQDRIAQATEQATLKHQANLAAFSLGTMPTCNRTSRMHGA
jgi:hypothetical protein